MKNGIEFETFSFQFEGQNMSDINSEQKGIFLARKIEVGMKARNLSRQSFAQLLGVQPSIVTRWLSGKHNFTIETLFEIERMLGITLFAIDLPTAHAMSFHMVVDSEYTHFPRHPNLPGIAGIVPTPQYYNSLVNGFVPREDDLLHHFYLEGSNTYNTTDGSSE